MFKPIPWGADMVPSTTGVGLESFADAQMTQGQTIQNQYPYFKPVNIAIEKGVYYATVYVCKAGSGTQLGQELAIWLSSLKETDHVHLTVSSLFLDIPLVAIIDLMGAFASTKAHIDIHLDTIVSDSLAYFYLLADHITLGKAGSLFIPSYQDQRDQDTSGPWKAIHDFYRWVVDHAVERGVLTTEEADKLHRGSHAIIPNSRFVKA